MFLEGFDKLSSYSNIYMLKVFVLCLSYAYLQIMINLLSHYKHYNFKIPLLEIFIESFSSLILCNECYDRSNFT